MKREHLIIVVMTAVLITLLGACSLAGQEAERTPSPSPSLLAETDSAGTEPEQQPSSPGVPVFLEPIPCPTPEPVPSASPPIYDEDLAYQIMVESYAYFQQYENDPNKTPLIPQWPRTYFYHYYEEGFDVGITSMDDEPRWGNYLHFSPTCKLKLYKGIGIGSTRDELLAAYAGAIDFENSTDDLINAAIYTWFLIKNDVIYSIYIATNVIIEAYWDFYPDRDWGFPLDVVEINEISLEEPGLFYLGESKEEIMLLIAEKNVAWSEYLRDDGSCVVTGDGFIFEFDEDRKLTTVAVDFDITPHLSGIKRGPYGLGFKAFSYDSFEKYTEFPFAETIHRTDELLPDAGSGYRKIAVDMGTHYYFVCYRKKSVESTRQPVRWGISVKEQD
jgi:hypothetical protein